MPASPLRKFSTEQIEQAVAKGLADLAGCEFVVELSGIKYKASEMDELTGKAERVEFAMTAKQKSDPLDITINYVDPDGSVSSSMQIGGNNPA